MSEFVTVQATQIEVQAETPTQSALAGDAEVNADFDHQSDDVTPENGLQESTDVIVVSSQQSSESGDVEIIGGKLTQSNPVNTLVVTFSIWDIIKKASINLVLPFINGMMLGFGEILAHEIGFRYNYIGARVQPVSRIQRKYEEKESKFL